MSLSSFKTSVNVKFDIGDADFIHRYLPTPSHGDALLGLTKAFLSESENAAHIMIGPYGSGKSLVATLLANMTAKAVDQDDMKLLVRKFEKVHQGIFNNLQEIYRLDKRYIPVTLNGDEGSFAEALVRQILRALEEEKISVEVAGVAETISEIIKNWKKEFPDTYHKFLTELQNRGYQEVKSWLAQVNQLSQAEIQWFEEIYRELTSGASLEQQIQVPFVDQLENILDALRKHNVGLFIIYDEFGRYLQSLDPAEINKSMQDIQDIAEFVNRAAGDIQLLLISHKSMSQYMLGFTEEYRSEFQRVEKRYSTYFVESDTATYYRVVDGYVTELAKEYPMQIVNFEPVIKELRMYNLFRELNSQEVEGLIVEGSYPIHPVSMFLLPRVSRVFGQNERTLFTFLESIETGGLRHHFMQGQDYYYPTKLFDYFFTDLEGFYLDEVNQNIVNRFKKNLSKIDEDNYNARSILKLITMWQLTDSNSVHPMTPRLVKFALGLENAELEEALDTLINKKTIRFNRVLKQLELYEGSALVLDEIIEEARSKSKITFPKRLDYIQRELPQKYFLATDYNDYYNITRFMRVRVITSKQLLAATEAEREKWEHKRTEDGFIILVLLSKKEDYEPVQKLLEAITNPFVLYAVLNREWKEILPIIDADLAIDYLLEDRQLLLEVDQLKEELLMRREELRLEFEEFIEGYFSFGEGVLWYHAQKQIPLRSILGLESYVSYIMKQQYPHTPIVMNDGVNRFHVKGMQKRALHTALHHVLNHPYEEVIGIEGQGPDYLVYATVFKNNGIDLKDLSAIQDSSMKQLRTDLLEQLKEHPTGDLTQLINIFKHPPYGVRPPLIPLLFVGLLRDRLEQLMFYRNDMFVPTIKEDVVYGMFEEPAGYTYVYHDFDEKELRYLQDAQQRLNEYISEYVQDKTILIQVSSGLLNYLRELPKFTQVTQEVDPFLSELKKVIRYSEVNPLDSFSQLYQLTERNIEKLFEGLKVLKDVYPRLEGKAKECLFNTIKVQSFAEVKEWVSTHTPREIGTNRLLKAIEASDDFEEFIESYMGVSLKDWSDATYQVYMSQVQQDYAATKYSSEQDNGNYYEIEYNGIYKRVPQTELSEKAQLVQKNVERIIERGGQRVPQAELENIILLLVDKYID